MSDLQMTENKIKEIQKMLVGLINSFS